MNHVQIGFSLVIAVAMLVFFLLGVAISPVLRSDIDFIQHTHAE
jgi:hypothetical protein